MAVIDVSLDDHPHHEGDVQTPSVVPRTPPGQVRSRTGRQTPTPTASAGLPGTALPLRLRRSQTPRVSPSPATQPTTLESHVHFLDENLDDFHHHRFPIQRNVGAQLASELEMSEAAAAAEKEKKRKKKKWWGQRDSLARRMGLQIGREGTKRRQRYNNNHLVEHMFAPSTDPDFIHPFDYEAGYEMPRKPTAFSFVRGDIRKKIVNVADPSPSSRRSARSISRSPLWCCSQMRKGASSWNGVTKTGSASAHMSSSFSRPLVVVGEQNLTKADRYLRQQLRRTQTRNMQQAVKDLEAELLLFVSSGLGDNVETHRTGEMDRCSSLESSFVGGFAKLNLDSDGDSDADNEDGLDFMSDAVPTRLALKITDKFLRLVVHAMCRFYGLISWSEGEEEGESRITYIHNPLAVLAALRRYRAAADTNNRNDDDSDDSDEATRQLCQKCASVLGNATFIPEKSFFDYVFA
ncbi:hypothetical protein HK102_014120 [Quaeritorhiza haematococci]|nr:hypothetical protein HK102_014120 [Quaeritorhiza haematococci]